MIPVSVVFTKTVTNCYPAIIVLQKAPTGTENLKPKSVVVPLRSAIQMFLSQNLWDGCLSLVNWRMERLLFVIDRKSTRLNSSHVRISYAVFCLKKKKKQQLIDTSTTTLHR